MHFAEGFFLGLSTGVVCLAYCGPILLPYLMAESHTVWRNYIDVGLFLGGRFVAYMITGMLAGIAGMFLFQNQAFQHYIMGGMFVLMALAVIAYTFYRFRHVCLGEHEKKIISGLGIEWPHAIPLVGGFVSGINLCPPFVLAITQAAAEKNVAGSMLFFLAFFLGTSLYFIPLPFIGFFRRKQALQITGKFAAGMAGAYFLYKGIFLIFH